MGTAAALAGKGDSFGARATADDVISTGDVWATAGIVSMDATAVKRGESTSFRSGIEAGSESGSITHPLSLGVGKRFDSESASATAKELHVHVHTVQYRLAKIEELSGLSLRDSEERLTLELSLRINDLASALSAGLGRRAPLAGRLPDRADLRVRRSVV